MPERPQLFWLLVATVHNLSYSRLIETKNKLSTQHTARRTCTKFESLSLDAPGALWRETLDFLTTVSLVSHVPLPFLQRSYNSD